MVTFFVVVLACFSLRGSKNWRTRRQGSPLQSKEGRRQRTGFVHFFVSFFCIIQEVCLSAFDINNKKLKRLEHRFDLKAVEKAVKLT